MIGQDGGLMPDDVEIAAVIDWGMEQMHTGSPVVSATRQLEMDADVLSRFLHANILNTLRVQGAYRPHVQQLAIGQKPQKLVIRHEITTQSVYAVQKDFRAFVIAAGFPYTAVVAELRSQRIIKDDTRMLTLGAATEYASVQVACVAFDGSHPISSSLLQEVPHVRNATPTMATA